jgi:hypothetical protein
MRTPPPIKPTMMEWDIGSDAYGRPVKLRATIKSGQPSEWTIHIVAQNQRDHDQRVEGLTFDNLTAIAEAAKSVR